MSKFDDRRWSSSEFRLYASNQDDELEKEIAEADKTILGLRVFNDTALNQELIDQTDKEGRAGRVPHQLVERLRKEPNSIGKMRGSLLDRTEAKLAAKELAVRLEARAELRRTQSKYDGLWRDANAASKLSKEEESQQLEGLRDKKAHCDVARESRKIEFRDAMDRLREEPEYRHGPDDARGRWFP